MRGDRELSCFERDETTSWMFLEKKNRGRWNRVFHWPLEYDWKG